MGIGASFIVGASVGFLFSIPRIVQRNGNNPGNANDGDDASQYQQHVNTNLTEISDWLTKIIVGLGLVNLGKLGPYLHTIAETLARGIKPADTNSVLALSYGI